MTNLISEDLDGEFKIVDGSGYQMKTWSPGMEERLRVRCDQDGKATANASRQLLFRIAQILD